MVSAARRRMLQSEGASKRSPTPVVHPVYTPPTAVPANTPPKALTTPAITPALTPKPPLRAAHGFSSGSTPNQNQTEAVGVYVRRFHRQRIVYTSKGVKARRTIEAALDDAIKVLRETHGLSDEQIRWLMQDVYYGDDWRKVRPKLNVPPPREVKMPTGGMFDPDPETDDAETAILRDAAEKGGGDIRDEIDSGPLLPAK